MSDAYAYWRAATKNGGRAPEGAEFLPTYHRTGTYEEPQPGLYKTRESKGGPFVPVRIWLVDEWGNLSHKWADGLSIAGSIDGKTVSADRLADRWIWCLAVSKADFEHYAANKTWPGDAELASNSANASPLELLRDYIETARRWFSTAKVVDQLSLDKAANYATELARLKGVADKERDAKVRPHLEAQREINAEYKPSIDEADTLAKQIKRACDGFMQAEKRRLEEEARKKYEAERAAAEAERKRIEAERAKQLREDPVAALTAPDPELPAAPPPPEPVKVQAGGQRGRKMSLRTVTVYEIADYDAVVAWAATRPEVVEFLTKHATAAARSGEEVPGIVKRTEERAA